MSKLSSTPTALPMADTERQTAFPPLLLDWYSDKKRDLPWRKTQDPYAIWVSEMMLQQTLVATVIPYWTRWMERFPTVGNLAASALDDVLQAWQGLGYYARARNMHRAAQVIQETHGGVFPTNFDAVLALPGIGRYTAGAICSIALGQDVPIVDANVIRVLCRVFGLHGDPKSTAVQERLWELAAALIPSGHARDFNQAMMELGALVCETKPRCGACPVQSVCAGFASGDPASLPEFAPKPVFTSQTDVSAILRHPCGDGRVLLIRRPEGGLWGGLWETPRVTADEGESAAEAAVRALREAAGMTAHSSGEVVSIVKHGVTTRKITLLGVACEAAKAEAETGGDPLVHAWAAPDELGTRYALSSPQTKLLQKILAKESQLSLF